VTANLSNGIPLDGSCSNGGGGIGVYGCTSLPMVFFSPCCLPVVLLLLLLLLLILKQRVAGRIVGLDRDNYRLLHIKESYGEAMVTLVKKKMLEIEEFNPSGNHPIEVRRRRRGKGTRVVVRHVLQSAHVYNHCSSPISYNYYCCCCYYYYYNYYNYDSGLR